MNVSEPHSSTPATTARSEASLASVMRVGEDERARAQASLDARSEAIVAPARKPRTPAAQPAPGAPVPSVGERVGQPAQRVQPARPAHGGLRLAATGLQLGAMLLLAYLCLFNFSIVRGSSMAPRIHDGDRILIDHVSYLFDSVEAGDIVVLKYPLDPSVDYIKRVIGLPGDEVVLEGGRVWVNGVEVAEPYVRDPDPLSRMTVHVKAAHFFVLGDNRQRSCDSREFGLVPQDYVRGKVEMRVWPLERIGLIDA